MHCDIWVLLRERNNKLLTSKGQNICWFPVSAMCHPELPLSRSTKPVSKIFPLIVIFSWKITFYLYNIQHKNQLDTFNEVDTVSTSTKTGHLTCQFNQPLLISAVLTCHTMQLNDCPFLLPPYFHAVVWNWSQYLWCCGSRLALFAAIY